ncbi:Oxoglutarate/iron-dependent oxygenase [Metarhizium album ARSEF 1941]|uniref:Oxoglutarate/iron-dependent oxygenase n=1 Tax=Metarhizium album (strain ARSEF 1941) TaxID=1081103 RepID=A0A0B2X858_METAS|nr:Oxoglutarate/iron-dependent oxygenase [Metarhizium album ARSEF 1941]KHO01486.1 Oxoglutarate/iron-dependent oxygenase [Metarhizium album ARSEF 1941]
MPPASAVIPIVDLSGPQADVAKQLVDAAADHGFIYIRNLGHDIPVASIDEAFALSEKLFSAPSDEKQACSIQTNNRGWVGMHAETLDPQNQKVGDFKEAFNFGEFINSKAQQPIPPTVAADEGRFSAFADLCRALSLKILTLLGQGLQVDDFFTSAHFRSPSGSGSTLRFLRYPPPSSTSHAAEDVRAGAHSDYGSITLLFRLKGQAGLEILKKDGTWAPVPVSPPGTENDASPPILVNIGDLLSYWTNGLFRSTVHRVVFPTNGADGVDGESSSEPRYSIAFFCQPMDDVLLEPVPSERVRSFVEDGVVKNPYAERKVVTARQHLFMRLRETYGTLYEDEKD